MVRFMSLSSGSAGNCYYLGTDSRGLLIDAGVSLRMMKKIFQNSALDLDSFSSILGTHDHMDHIRSLGSYCKRLKRPVYTTSALSQARFIGVSPVRECTRVLEEGCWNDVNGFQVRYFVVPHDATQTVGYAIRVEGHKFVIMTDIGHMTEEALAFASQADTVVIESNYDMDMLISGPYPHELKMRICQGHGHLSNEECAAAIMKFWHPGLRNLFLCHMSENNNTPDLAYDSARKALESLGVESGSVNLRALPRRLPSPLMIL